MKNEQIENALAIAEQFNSLKRAEKYLNSVGITTFGIEYVNVEDKKCSYINMGDTYDTTILYDGEYSIGSWGDWIEETEAEYAEENNLIRCGYCGEYTELDTEDWRDCICEHCNNKVGG